jgi:hypothetical protein
MASGSVKAVVLRGAAMLTHAFTAELSRAAQFLHVRPKLIQSEAGRWMPRD